MKVHFTLVGHQERPDDIHLDLDAVPRVGDVVDWPGISQARTYVRTVVWYLTNDDDGRPLGEPFVYVVVGPARPWEPPESPVAKEQQP
jgi:hypothetical protein